MTQRKNAAMPSHKAGKGRSRLVWLAELLVSTAFAAGLYQHAAISAAAAAGAGVAVMILLITINQLASRSAEVDELNSELQNLEGEVWRLSSGIDGAGSDLRGRDNVTPEAAFQTAQRAAQSLTNPQPKHQYRPLHSPAHAPLDVAPVMQPGLPQQPVTAQQALAQQSSARQPVLAKAIPHWRSVKAAQAELERQELSAAAGPTASIELRNPPPIPSQSSDPAPIAEESGDALASQALPWPDVTGRQDLISDYFSASATAPADQQAVAPPSPSLPPREAELAYVGDMIRLLASEVNNAEELRAAQSVPVRPQAPLPQPSRDTPSLDALSDAISAALPPIPDPGREQQSPVQSPASYLGDPGSLIPASAKPVAYAPSAFNANSSVPPNQPQATQHLSPPTAPAPTLDHPLAAEVNEAIDTGRVDVFLSPIIGLLDRRTRHYEISLQLRGKSGANLSDAVISTMVQSPATQARYDADRLTRTTNLAVVLADSGKPGVVLTRINAHSVAASQFVAAVSRVSSKRPGIASKIVLTLNDADVRELGGGSREALADMRDAGFRFAIDNFINFDADFAAYRRLGFAFVKVTAQTLLSGFASSRGQVSPEDACRMLAGAELALIVDGIDTEAQRAAVFELGVLFGQGALFGGARHVPAPAGSLGARSSSAAA